MRIRDWASHAWGALGVALALIFGIPSLAAAGHYERTPWWVWPGVALAAIFFLGAVYFFVAPLFHKRSRSPGKQTASRTPAVEVGTEPGPEAVAGPVSGPAITQERIAYRVSDRGRARPVRPRIRNQDVAFDIHDEGEVDDTDSDIG